jgi:hypothetical protein
MIQVGQVGLTFTSELQLSLRDHGENGTTTICVDSFRATSSTAAAAAQYVTLDNKIKCLS